MSDARTLKDRAASLIARRRFAKAAEVLAEAVEADPRDLASRQMLADALRRAGDGPRAVAAYRDAASLHAARGDLIKAIAICKVILEIDPAHVETQTALARLYARRTGGPREAVPQRDGPSRRGGETTGVTLPAVPLGKLKLQPIAAEVPAGDGPAPRAPGVLVTPYEVIVSAAREAATAGVDDPLTHEIEIDVSTAAFECGAEARPEPPALPQQDGAAWQGVRVDVSRLPVIPLFSDLSHQAFVELAGRLTLHRVPTGQTILCEGELGWSFFILASGSVRVEKAAQGGPVVLAQLAEGAFFGEMALLSGAQRVASVVAEEPCELLELRAEVLEDLSRAHPHVAASLQKFYRQRLLANAMATSPLFRPFQQKERLALMRRFHTREVPSETVLLREGEPSEGLFVVLSGEVDVKKRRRDGDLLVARLAEGDVFGEMSCLRKTPASATVVARRRSMLLCLPRGAFDELVAAYPPVRAIVAELTDARQQRLDAMVAGQHAHGYQGLLLV